MIRWKGFLPFLFFAILLSVVYLFYANYVVKNTVELLGWEINQASVDLTRAKVSISPLGFDMRGLQVANAKLPMRNVVQVGKIRFQMDPVQMLHLNWVINEMSVEEIQFDTPRKFKAKVAQSTPNPESAGTPTGGNESTTAKPEKKPAAKSESDIANILETENLQSLKLAQDLQQRSQKLKDNWQTAKTTLPTREKLDQYKKRIKQLDLKNAKDVIKHRKEISAIRKELKADIKALGEAQQHISKDVKAIDQDYKQLKKVYKQELDRLKDKYAFNQQGMENYARLFFGNSSNKWLREGLYWYDRLKPYLSNRNTKPEAQPVNRWKGTNVAFLDRHPTPRFLLKSAKLSINTDMGQISGQLLDISSDQLKTRRPAQFILHSTDLNRARSLDSKAVFDFTQDTGKTRVQTKVLEWRVKDWNISQDKQFPLKLAQANVDFSIDAQIVEEKLSGGFEAVFKQVNFDTKENTHGMSAVINNAFKNIRQFTLFGNLKGSVKSPRIHLRSDLDSVIKTAMGKELKKMSLAYQKKLEGKLSEKLENSLGDSLKNSANLKNLGSDLGSVKNKREEFLAQFEKDLKAKQQQKLDNKKQRLKDKLKKKIKF